MYGNDDVISCLYGCPHLHTHWPATVFGQSFVNQRGQVEDGSGANVPAIHFHSDSIRITMSLIHTHTHSPGNGSFFKPFYFPQKRTPARHLFTRDGPIVSLLYWSVEAQRSNMLFDHPTNGSRWNVFEALIPINDERTHKNIAKLNINHQNRSDRM